MRKANQRRPEVSVVVPTYNNALLLRDALQSVLAQTFADFELIVVDDGSTDDTAAVVAAFRPDPRVRYICQPHRGSGGAARNTGIRQSQGALIALLDGDDLCRPERLARQVAAMAAHPQVGVVWCAAHIQHLDPDGRLRAQTTHRYRPGARFRYLEQLLGPGVHAFGSATMVRAACFERVGLFDEAILVSDRDMCHRLSSAYPFLYQDEPLIAYRRHGANMTTNIDLMMRECRKLFARLEAGAPAASRRLWPVAWLLYHGIWARDFFRSGQYRKSLDHALRLLGLGLRHPLNLLRALLNYGEARLAPRRRAWPGEWLISVDPAAGVRAERIGVLPVGLAPARSPRVAVVTSDDR